MADSAGELVIRVIARDCKVNSCPYHYGDGVAIKKVVPKINQKLVDRVSDGNEVRALKNRLKRFEVEAFRIADAIEKNRPLSSSDASRLKALISPPKAT